MNSRFMIIIAALVLVPLSGCVSGGDASEAPVEDADSPAGFTDDTGAIQGSVLNDEGLPVAEATVALTGAGREAATSTNEAGVFAFSQVAPGTYDLFIQKLGFESIGRSVQVVVGQVTTVEATLATIAVAEPHYVIQQQEGTIQCSVRAYPGAPLTGVIAPGWYTGVAVCGLPGIGTVTNNVMDPERFLIPWEMPDAMSELLAELTWQSTQATGRGLSFVVEHDGHINDGTPTYGSLPGENPIRIHVTQAKMEQVQAENGESSCLETQCALVTRVFAEANTTNLDWPTEPPTVPEFGQMHKRMVDVGLVLNQRFTEYMTSFHYQEMPDQYTALPEA